MTPEVVKAAPGGFDWAGVRLRPLQEADLPLTLAWRNREGVRQRFVHTDVISGEAHRAWYLKYLEKVDDIVFIASKQSDETPCGQLAIYAIDVETGEAEVGRFIVSPEAAGTGLMRRALECLIELARSQLRLRRLVLSVRDDNERAIRLYAALGFAERARNAGMIDMSLDISRGS